ncbi:MAG TPA: aliphatic sulfonate ABC transporter substrate-binding protein [Solirubrobacterales bacterium]
MERKSRNFARRRAAVLTVLAALLASLALAACGGGGSSSSSSTSSSSGSGSSGSSSSATTASSSSASTQGVTVNLGILQGATLAAVAKHIGSLEEELGKQGAKVSYQGPFPAMVPAVEAMNAGDVDITYGSISASVGALAGNSDFKIFAIEPEQPTNEGIIVSKDSGITSLADLKGKKIAVNEAGTGEYLALLALQKAGLSKSDVTLVNLAPPEAAAAFGSGQVDAWATWSSFTGLAEDEMGGKMLIDGGELGSLNDTPFIVTTSFAEKYPTLVKAVYEGLQDAATWIAENQSEATKFYEEEGLSPSVAKAQAKAGNKLEAITEPAQTERFQKVADFVYEQGVVPSEVDMSERTFNVEEAK